MKQNTENSPPPRLPVKLRQQIWGYVLGDQTLHIKRRKYWNEYGTMGEVTSYVICGATVTERDPYQHSRSEGYENSQGPLEGKDLDLRVC